MIALHNYIRNKENEFNSLETLQSGSDPTAVEIAPEINAITRYPKIGVAKNEGKNKEEDRVVCCVYLQYEILKVNYFFSLF